MSFKILSRGILCAAVFSFAAGIFSAEVFAAKSTTPTSFSRSIKIPSTTKTNNANNEDSFFHSNDRQAQRKQRKNERLNRNKSAKVNDGNEQEARTREIVKTETKGRRNRMNRQERMQRAQKLTTPSNASSSGINE